MASFERVFGPILRDFPGFSPRAWVLPDPAPEEEKKNPDAIPYDELRSSDEASGVLFPGHGVGFNSTPGALFFARIPGLRQQQFVFFFGSTAKYCGLGLSGCLFDGL